MLLLLPLGLVLAVVKVADCEQGVNLEKLANHLELGSPPIPYLPIVGKRPSRVQKALKMITETPYRQSRYLHGFHMRFTTHDTIAYA